MDENSYGSIIKEQFNNIVDGKKLDSLEEYAEKLTEGRLDAYSVSDILDSAISADSLFDPQHLIEGFKSLFLYELQGSLLMCGQIIIICIVSGLLTNMSGTLGRKSVAEAGNMICGIVVIGLSLINMKNIYTVTEDAIGAMSVTMETLLPVLLIILVSMGAVASGTIMSPVLITSVTIFSTVIRTIIMPAVFASAFLSMLNCLTEKDYVNMLADALRKASLFVTGFMITLLSGIIAIQGLITKTSDSLLMNTTRFSISKFIPIVGGFTSDTIELFIRCMTSIKAVVGIFGILLLIAMILSPIIKTLASAVVFKVTAIIAEPLTDTGLAESLDDVGNAMITLTVLIFSTALLFIIFISVIMNLGSIT